MDGEHFMENPIKIHDLGGFYTPIFGNTAVFCWAVLKRSTNSWKISVQTNDDDVEKQI